MSYRNGRRDHQMRRVMVLPLLVTLVLALPSAAAARVRLHVTSPVRAGSYATVTARVSPSKVASKVKCKITVYYSSGIATAEGLYPRRPRRGRVTWRWKVGSRTKSGRVPIIVDCGKAGRAQTSFRVI
jgi:hypothetical protein